MDLAQLPTIAQRPLHANAVFAWAPETEQAIAEARSVPLVERLRRRRAAQPTVSGREPLRPAPMR